MKRFLFCCLRGGNCEIDIHGRRKCNFCRYQKCLSIGMSTKPKHEDVLSKLQGPKETENYSSPHTLSHIESQNVTVDENNQSTAVVTLSSNYPSSSESFKMTLTVPPLSSLASEVEKVKYIKQLYSIQCELDPVHVNTFIPLLEATRKGQSYDKRIVIFSEKVFKRYLTKPLVYEMLI